MQTLHGGFFYLKYIYCCNIYHAAANHLLDGIYIDGTFVCAVSHVAAIVGK
jgi:hypothetical protein